MGWKTWTYGLFPGHGERRYRHSTEQGAALAETTD